MRYPEFYDKVEPFTLYDGLSNFLGATEGGIIEINYLDCVKLAGHSCPTVAGSYILAKTAVKKLYGSQMAHRSNIKIEFKEQKEHQVTGVIGSVLGFILGASDSGGFSGIGGKFNRRSLLEYGVEDVNGMVKFTRLDNGSCITLTLDTSAVPGNPEMKPLMQKALLNQATEEEKQEFKKLWQERVEFMLTNPQIWDKISGI